jgi:transcriptional regulator with XRE-family HTH domain
MPKRFKSVSDMPPKTFSCWDFAGNGTVKSPIAFPVSGALQIRQADPKTSQNGAVVETKGSHGSNVNHFGHIARPDEPKKNEGWTFLGAWNFEVERYRHITHKTNSEIAADLGISRNYFQAITYGQKIPGMEVILMAAMVFGLSPTTLSDHPALAYLVDQFGRRLKVR